MKKCLSLFLVLSMLVAISACSGPVAEPTTTPTTEPTTAPVTTPTTAPATDSPATEPCTTEPSATAPSATVPSATVPSASVPSASVPSASVPSATEPSATEPSATEPSVTEPSATEPSVTEPSTAETSAAELLQAIDGYYWYLDGYKYTYIYPNIIPWYGHECLDWDSKNIYITQETLVAYENYEPERYWKYENELSACSTTHNTLLVNPIEYADSLITDFNMHVSGNKLYMTIGGTQYSFTRYSSLKQVDFALKLGFTEATVTVGECVFLPVEVSPFWEYYQIEVVEDAYDDFSIAYHDAGDGSDVYSGDGTATLVFYAESVGERTFTIRVEGMTKYYTLKIKVEAAPPKNVTGISLSCTSLDLCRGDTSTITAVISPSDATNKNIEWTSSDESVATVSSAGTVTAVSNGTATITATSVDGGYSATCTITVTDPPLTVDASIGVSMVASGSSTVRGVFVEVNAAGGSGEYVEYHIKVYFNGELVAEGTDQKILVTLANGTYTAEVYVKDSKGNEATDTASMTLSGY